MKRQDISEVLCSMGVETQDSAAKQAATAPFAPQIFEQELKTGSKRRGNA